MHELTIAQAIIETVIEEKDRLGLREIYGITVRVGALSSIYPDALEFGFDALRQGTSLRESRLNIEWVPVELACRACGASGPGGSHVFTCPACGSNEVDVIAGYELEIDHLDVLGDEDVPELQIQQNGVFHDAEN